MSSTFVSERGSTMSANGGNSSCSSDVTDTTRKLGSHKVMLVEIMILIFHMTCLMVFLAVFGAWRRKSRACFWKVTLWISSTTSAALVPFILGLIQEAPFKDELLIIWGMLLFIVYGFPDSFSAYSTEDVTQWRMHYIQFLVKFLALALLWLRAYSKGHSHLYFVDMCLFTWIVFHKVEKRSLAHFSASSSSIEERAKIFEVYKASEQNLSNESLIDPVNMKGYIYVIAVTGSNILTLDDVLPVTPSDPSYLTKLIKRNDVVTLQKVWQCEGRLRTERGDSDNRLKDICLSYSLLKILYLKCAGYVLPMEAQPKARKLIIDGLLSKNENDRAFRVIEVELTLLYELIYTRYPLYVSPIFAVLRSVEFVHLLIVCGLSATYISKYADSLESVEVAKVGGFNLDVLVTYVLLGMIVFAEIAQVWMIFSSECVKAALIFNYVANKYCLNNIFAEKLITMVCKRCLWKPWAGVLGQYSLFESRGYGTKPWISDIASAICPDKNWDWQKERKAILLSHEVKGANSYNLENLRRSLRHNGMYEDLPGVCKCEHEAQVILVWHIATSYCQHNSPAPKSSKNYKIANDPSNSLAYLVAFASRLLPGPHFEPQLQFRRVMKEVREAFGGCKKAEDRIHKLDELATLEDQKIVVRGALLGKKLFQRENEDIWKTLAEFWSDMALCAATSGEVRANLDKLANGGEFITHLWALLHHGYSPRTWLDSCDVTSTVEDNQPSRMMSAI